MLRAMYDGERNFNAYEIFRTIIITRPEMKVNVPLYTQLLCSTAYPVNSNIGLRQDVGNCPSIRMMNYQKDLAYS